MKLWVNGDSQEYDGDETDQWWAGEASAWMTPELIEMYKKAIPVLCDKNLNANLLYDLYIKDLRVVIYATETPYGAGDCYFYMYLENNPTVAIFAVDKS